MQVLTHLSIIVAVANNRVIGGHNALPWSIPKDMARFVEITKGKTVIVGRKTWESIPGVLPGRRVIVVTRDSKYTTAAYSIASSVQAAIGFAGNSSEVVVIGGGETYMQALPYVSTIHLTIVDTEVEGDTVFPPLMGDWRAVEGSRGQYSAPEGVSHPDVTFMTLRRVPPQPLY